MRRLHAVNSAFCKNEASFFKGYYGLLLFRFLDRIAGERQETMGRREMGKDRDMNFAGNQTQFPGVMVLCLSPLGHITLKLKAKLGLTEHCIRSYKTKLT